MKVVGGDKQFDNLVVIVVLCDLKFATVHPIDDIEEDRIVNFWKIDDEALSFFDVVLTGMLEPAGLSTDDKAVKFEFFHVGADVDGDVRVSRDGERTISFVKGVSKKITEDHGYDGERVSYLLTQRLRLSLLEKSVFSFLAGGSPVGWSGAGRRRGTMKASEPGRWTTIVESSECSIALDRDEPSSG